MLPIERRNLHLVLALMAPRSIAWQFVVETQFGTAKLSFSQVKPHSAAFVPAHTQWDESYLCDLAARPMAMHRCMAHCLSPSGRSI